MKQKVYIIDCSLCNSVWDEERDEISDRNEFKNVAAKRGRILSIEDFEKLYNQDLIHENSVIMFDY